MARPDQGSVLMFVCVGVFGACLERVWSVFGACLCQEMNRAALDSRYPQTAFCLCSLSLYISFSVRLRVCMCVCYVLAMLVSNGISAPQPLQTVNVLKRKEYLFIPSVLSLSLSLPFSPPLYLNLSVSLFSLKL